MEEPGADVTVLMTAAAEGDALAAGALLPLVYAQLRRAAQQQLGSERAGHTLTATALVHEAYLKLVGPRDVAWTNRAHFYAAAAQAMRRILIDHARERQTVKRGRGKRPACEIEGLADLAAEGDPEEIMAVDAAILRLESEDPDAAMLVRLRFYAGLTMEHAALALGISVRQAHREWTYARAVLLRELRAGDGQE